MPDFKERLAGMRLPSWMNRGEPAKLLRACRNFWLWVYDWLTWPLKQLDAVTCAVPLLQVLAYQ
ncbi:hypothetical protein JEQ07_25625, partial [Serratia proteamaculans]|nr:hypothetical protein [Serratia proteamaculans]